MHHDATTNTKLAAVCTRLVHYFVHDRSAKMEGQACTLWILAGICAINCFEQDNRASKKALEFFRRYLPFRHPPFHFTLLDPDNHYFRYFYPVSKNWFWKAAYVAFFAADTTIVQWGQKHIGMWKNIRWKDIYTFIFDLARPNLSIPATSDTIEIQLWGVNIV